MVSTLSVAVLIKNTIHHYQSHTIINHFIHLFYFDSVETSLYWISAVISLPKLFLHSYRQFVRITGKIRLNATVVRHVRAAL